MKGQWRLCWYRTGPDASTPADGALACVRALPQAPGAPSVGPPAVHSNPRPHAFADGRSECARLAGPATPHLASMEGCGCMELRGSTQSTCTMESGAGRGGGGAMKVGYTQVEGQPLEREGGNGVPPGPTPLRGSHVPYVRWDWWLPHALTLDSPTGSATCGPFTPLQEGAVHPVIGGRAPFNTPQGPLDGTRSQTHHFKEEGTMQIDVCKTHWGGGAGQRCGAAQTPVANVTQFWCIAVGRRARRSKRNGGRGRPNAPPVGVAPPPPPQRAAEGPVSRPCNTPPAPPPPVNTKPHRWSWLCPGTHHRRALVGGTWGTNNGTISMNGGGGGQWPQHRPSRPHPGAVCLKAASYESGYHWAGERWWAEFGGYKSGWRWLGVDTTAGLEGARACAGPPLRPPQPRGGAAVRPGGSTKMASVRHLWESTL